MNTERVARTLKLLTLIHSGRALSVAQLVAELRVTRRTVYRDLALLRNAGVPITYDRKMRCFAFGEDCFVPPIEFTEQECLAMMFLTRKVLATGLWPDKTIATQAMRKLEDALPTETRERCESTLAKMELKMPAFSSLGTHLDVFNQLQAALTLQCKVKLVYEPTSKGRFVDCVHPYHVAFVQSGWYVFGYSETTEAVRTFKIERILDCQTLDDHFDIEEPFDLSEYYGNAWQLDRAAEEFHVLLKFTPEAADNIEETSWHSTQETWRTKSDCLFFDAHVDGLEEISSWVLGHGEGVKVFEPAELAALVERRARQIAQMYEQSDKADPGDA